MKAARIHAYQTPPAIEEAAVPEAGPDEVVVRVAAAALNPLDTKIQRGFAHDFFPVTFPYTLGTDLSGTIERLGSNVRGWAVGDAIVARTHPPQGGALAEFAIVPADLMARLPASLPIVEAAGVPTAAGTTWQALFEVAQLQRGQTILIHAAAGGVGSFAVQMARNAGARVIATASGAGIDIARSLGSDQVIDYRSEPFEDAVSDVDVVLDTIGDDVQARSFGVLRRGGYLVSTVSTPDTALAQAHGVDASFVFHQSDAARLARVLDEVASGRVKVLVDRTVALAALPDAFAYQLSGRARGKIIVGLER